jgi:hypothetical protein
LIATWLGQSPDQLELGAVRVNARVRAEGDVFVLVLSLESPAGSGREEHTARRCDTLAKIVALKVALAVDPVAALQTVEPRPTSEPRAASTPVRDRSAGLALRLAGGIAFGPLPGIAPTATLVGSLRWPGFRVELGAGYWFARSITYDTLPTVGARLQMYGAVARICPTATLGEVEIPLCAGVEAGVVRASGFGVPEARTSDRPWVALIVGPALVIPLFDGLHLWLEADAGFGFVLPSFRVQNLPRLYQAENGAAQAWAGLEFRL